MHNWHRGARRPKKRYQTKLKDEVVIMSQREIEIHSEFTDETALKSGLLRKILLFIAGTLFLSIGMIGIAIPLLPTTPFLLLALWCYLRSSKKMYRWMLSNRIFGKYLKDYHEGKGIPIRVKIGTILFLWIVLIISILIIKPETMVKIIFLVIGILVSIHIISIGSKKF